MIELHGNDSDEINDKNEEVNEKNNYSLSII